MQNVYDLALFGLADLLVSAGNPGAPRQIARQQDEHAPEGYEEKELIGVHGGLLDANAKLAQRLGNDEQKNRPVPASSNGGGEAGAQDEESKVAHGSIPRDVAVDQVQADQQDSGRAKDDEAKKFVEVHESLLVVVRRIKPMQHRSRDQDHSDHGQQDLDGEEDGVHLGLGLLPQRAQALQLAITSLRQHDQLLTERELGVCGSALQKIADGGLAAVADRGDLHLTKTAFLNA